MWALVENNLVTQVYTRPKAITIGDVNYPSNIFMLWSSQELEAIGIYEVVVDNSNYKDPGYYINTDQSFDFAIVDQQAYGLLQPNDWYVVRNQEAGTAIPADWTTYRTDVRSTAADMVSKISAVTTVDELAALYTYNDAEPPVRPLGEWPIPPSS